MTRSGAAAVDGGVARRPVARDARRGFPVLIAAGDEGMRRRLVESLRAASPEVGAVLEAADGPEAVQLGLQRRPVVALLDLDLPRLGGLETALTLRSLQPATRVAVHGADPRRLRDRAGGLGLPLFDAAEPAPFLAWAARQLACAEIRRREERRVAPLARKLELACSLCGYGAVSREPPGRCPMCGAAGSWTHRSARRLAGAAAVPERLRR